MGLYAVTGAASGIGAAIVERLRRDGHEVITVDLRNADLKVDLATADGRQQAIEAIAERAAATPLAGLVPCAGVGPHTSPRGLIARINYFGSIALLEGLRPQLEQARGSVVLISSNSAPMEEYDRSYTDALLAGDEETAAGLADSLPGQTCYGGSKYALAVWMRRNNADWARAGIRMNAVAPGYTETALVEATRDDPEYAQVMREFVASIPVGRPGRPEDQADAVAFLLGEQASFISGSVLFIDGGHDAMFRPDRF